MLWLCTVSWGRTLRVARRTVARLSIRLLTISWLAILGLLLLVGLLLVEATRAVAARRVACRRAAALPICRRGADGRSRRLLVKAAERDNAGAFPLAPQVHACLLQTALTRLLHRVRAQMHVIEQQAV